MKHIYVTRNATLDLQRIMRKREASLKFETARYTLSDRLTRATTDPEIPGALLIRDPSARLYLRAYTRDAGDLRVVTKVREMLDPLREFSPLAYTDGAASRPGGSP